MVQWFVIHFVNEIVPKRAWTFWQWLVVTWIVAFGPVLSMECFQECQQRLPGIWSRRFLWKIHWSMLRTKQKLNASNWRKEPWPEWLKMFTALGMCPGNLRHRISILQAQQSFYSGRCRRPTNSLHHDEIGPRTVTPRETFLGSILLCPSIFVVYICRSIGQTVDLPIYLSVCLSIYLSIFLIYLIYLIYLSI